MKTLLTVMFLLGSLTVFANTDVMTNEVEVIEGQNAVAVTEASICNEEEGKTAEARSEERSEDSNGVINEG